jgi:hypothetical protein
MMSRGHQLGILPYEQRLLRLYEMGVLQSWDGTNLPAFWYMRVYMLHVADSGCGRRHGWHPGHEPHQPLVRTWLALTTSVRLSSTSRFGAVMHWLLCQCPAWQTAFPHGVWRTTCKAAHESKACVGCSLAFSGWVNMAHPPVPQVLVRCCA